MATQAELKAKNPAIVKAFSFVLYNVTQGTKTLLYAPDGWEQDEYVMTRDMKSFGVFRKFTVALMKFPKDGRDYLELVYEADGVNADCTFTVTETTPLGTVRNRFTGKIDFSTYEIGELTVNGQVLDGAFTDTILSRAKTEVNLLGLTSIDGVTLAAQTLENITIPEISIDQAGNMVAKDTVTALTESHYLQTEIIDSDFSELTTSIGLFTKFFDAAVDDYTGLQFSFDVQAIIDGSGTFTWNFFVEIWNGGSVTSTPFTDSFENTGHLPRSFQMQSVLTLDLVAGDSIGFRVELTGTGGTIQYSKINYNLLFLAESIPARSIFGLLYHEAFERLVQHLTGLTGRFKSDFLGRTDLGYAADGTTIGAVTVGRYIRQQTGYNNTFPISLDGLFSSLQAIWNLGLGVELIGGVETLVIEEMSHFFNSTVILDISARIAPETISKKVYPDLIYNRISVGYNSYDYGKLGGIFEYNTTSKFTTIIKPVDKELQIISPYRGDMSGIVALMKEPIENRDVSGEKDIFLIDTIRDGGNFVARTIEGFTNYSTLGNKDILLNLLISPARNLIRWGSYIRGFLNKYVTSSLIWQTSDKNTKLSTTLTDQQAVEENADILVGNLTEPLWHPETFTIEVQAIETDIEAIKANPYGLIKLTSTEYGYIINYKSNNENRKSEFMLLRCNTDYVTPSDQTPPTSDITITKVITGLPADTTVFRVTILNSVSHVRYLRFLTQATPIVITLPYGSYEITEGDVTGYTLISIATSPVVLSAGSPHGTVLSTSEKN